MAFANPTPLREEIDRVMPSRPFHVDFWDGSSLPATENGGGGPTFSVRSPKAVAQALAAPGQLGLGRAYVTGDLAVDDIDAVTNMLRDWSPPPIENADKLKLMAGAVRAAGLTLPPRPPAAEFRPKGRRHTRARDQRAVRHHYDVSNDYFRLFLDESMTYSCAIFSRGATTLEEAQVAKLDLVCTKLDLKPGMRIVDIGSGWGAFAIHAAKNYGVHVTGITVSQNQADGATENARQAGVGDKVDFRVQDYRDLTGETFDAVASIGMVEHVGEERIDEYTRKLASLVEPGGQVLNHGIARLRHSDPEAGDFSERYVFPDADPHPRVAHHRLVRARGHAAPARRGLPHGLRRDAEALGRAVRLQPGGGRAAGRRRAHTRLAAVPARRAQRVRDRLHRALPGARAQGRLR